MVESNPNESEPADSEGEASHSPAHVESPDGQGLGQNYSPHTDDGDAPIGDLESASTNELAARMQQVRRQIEEQKAKLELTTEELQERIAFMNKQLAFFEVEESQAQEPNEPSGP